MPYRHQYLSDGRGSGRTAQAAEPRAGDPHTPITLTLTKSRPIWTQARLNRLHSRIFIIPDRRSRKWRTRAGRKATSRWSACCGPTRRGFPCCRASGQPRGWPGEPGSRRPPVNRKRDVNREHISWRGNISLYTVYIRVCICMRWCMQVMR